MSCTDFHVEPRRKRWQGMLCLLPLYPLLDLYPRRFGGANVVALNCKERGKRSIVEESEIHLCDLEKLTQVGRSVTLTAIDGLDGRSGACWIDGMGCTELCVFGHVCTEKACSFFSPPPNFCRGAILGATCRAMERSGLVQNSAEIRLSIGVVVGRMEEVDYQLEDLLID
ncbi:unnamed protein product [Taenia asiatica]|uniref:DUF4773 domain-containing protein n=1 Tax=Taenia asiatica TaxID=60517 RepID=A0A0R3WEM8_TAEAS|nr:unnamed protein product [Taenia asiatica]